MQHALDEDDGTEVLETEPALSGMTAFEVLATGGGQGVVDECEFGLGK